MAVVSVVRFVFAVYFEVSEFFDVDVEVNGGLFLFAGLGRLSAREVTTVI